MPSNISSAMVGRNTLTGWRITHEEDLSQKPVIPSLLASTGQRLTLGPRMPRMAGSSVRAAATHRTMPTMPTIPRDLNITNSKLANPIEPDHDREAGEQDGLARRRDGGGDGLLHAAVLQFLPEPTGHEEGVVEPQAEPQHRRHVDDEDGEVGRADSAARCPP